MPSENQDTSAPQPETSSLEQIRTVLLREGQAIQDLAGNLNDDLNDSVRLLLNCTGRLIVTGMGKMGLVARKACATFCSTGTPAIFLHPGEAVHGDLGIVTQQDVVLALSKSGETTELNALLPYFSRIGVPLISLTGNHTSSLAKHSAAIIDVGTADEADPISLAPTTSTTVALAMCDALAVALMHRRGFTKEQFAIFHPGGNLGRKLLLLTRQVMHQGDEIPMVTADQPLDQTMLTISQKRMGCAAVVDSKKKLIGIFTDGDLRRTFESAADPNENRLKETVQQHMTENPVTIGPDSLAAESLRLMEARKITVLVVVDADQKVIGIVHLHDLLRMGLA